MSPELVIALHRRGIAFDRTLGASVPAEPDSRCAVQRIRPSCKQFTTPSLEARRWRTPSAWARLRTWFERRRAS